MVERGWWFPQTPSQKEPVGLLPDTESPALAVLGARKA